ncbi:MAG: GNAT family N-acetyltransferase [Nanoarchaeota archaeon]|nr:GNAT family N-acetyltransferase [Nanoarchaeota archaeon]
MKLETKRLILRTPKISDWKDIVEGIGNLKVSKNVSSVPYPYKKKDALDWINKQIKESKKKKKKGYSFVIELKSEKKIIGGSGLHKLNLENGTAETGSWIAEPYWRKGFATEAKIAINNFAFDKLKLIRLESRSFIDNKASNQMSKKLGLKLEGTLRQSEKCKATRKVHDANIWGILKEGWKKKHKIK